MSQQKNILEKAIEEQMNEARYEVPKEKKKKKNFNMQIILIIGVLLGLIASLLRLFM
ncbi:MULTISPECIES: hypothetical protein [unclassified Granulicatella]|uniref:hypothetical protein n=1 Tax=unclassified Granulicatella TaxID=2630493 RepID=UPI001430E3C7|nr:MULTISPECIES: hypothetical protein [unclassified Granulicatella]MBF0780170.1 hypothetical protein [Granulicatella sp. 19428wC4_WM01]